MQTTRWSLVRSAALPREMLASQQALEELCATYWFPLYAFARRKGQNANDAHDSVQGFFLELLEGSFLTKADETRGKFRSFLLKSFSNFLLGEHRAATAAKRGGQAVHESIGQFDGESRYQVAANSESPEQLFERQWVMALLDAAIEKLKQEYHESGKGELCDRLLPHLTQAADLRPYAEIAESLAMQETAIKVAMHRMRKRYRDLLRQQVADTVQPATEAEVDEELKWLMTVLARGG